MDYHADTLLLLAVLLPPVALDDIGAVVEERTLETPYGPVGPLALRELANGLGVWIQPYTGAPTRTDPRAVVYAAHTLGVRQILNWDQVVALNGVLGRGQVGAVADVIDWTRQPNTFAGAFPAQPMPPGARRPLLCTRLVAALHQAMPYAVDMVYLGVDGPRRETPAEAQLFRQWGADVVGRNLTPETTLAQEARICYAGLVTVGDLAADRAPAVPQGEVRASLEATLSALPLWLELIATSADCECGAHGGAL